ncbi:MAG TPA: sigma-70 family RNA polymerase sigma factor [Acidobacteriota bacterium]|nr:sigma-70 family RNA polymerase sigma factor [Acidobacteriota bacterium]
MFKKLFAFQDPTTSTEADSEERNWILAAQKGDQHAFQMLYESYHDRFYNITYYTLKDIHLTEDTVQTIFLKIYRGLPSYRFESSFLTWAYRIAINEAKNQLRNKRNELPLAVLSGTAHEIHSNAGPHEDQLIQQREAIVRRAVMELSPKLRTVIVLKYVNSLSYEEIASVLNCSQGTVASRLNRAVEKLESILAPFRNLL